MKLSCTYSSVFEEALGISAAGNFTGWKYQCQEISPFGNFAAWRFGRGKFHREKICRGKFHLT